MMLFQQLMIYSRTTVKSLQMTKVKDLGQKAVAITDHGNMYGVVDFMRLYVSKQSSI